MSLLGDLVEAGSRLAKSWVPQADLDERDPDYIREALPPLWLLSSFYHRSQVRGLENIPEEGPCIVVCNHVSFADAVIVIDRSVVMNDCTV